MDNLFRSIEKNKSRNSCVTAFANLEVESKEMLWGSQLRKLTPGRLITAVLMLEDPLMVIAGEAYRLGQVRDYSFDLQEKAVKNLRGNRKLTKAKMADALSCLKPNEDQTKIIAAILFAIHSIQTVCYNEDKKTVWTVPEDLRVWSRDRKTVWVDSTCDSMLDKCPNLGAWLSDREEDRWTIEWPVADGTMEDIKAKVLDRGITPKGELGAKVKKDDWARTLGRAEAIEHLGL